MIELDIDCLGWKMIGPISSIEQSNYPITRLPDYQIPGVRCVIVEGSNGDRD